MGLIEDLQQLRSCLIGADSVTEASKWNFANEDARFRNIVYAGGSKVLDKMSKQTTRKLACALLWTAAYLRL